MSLRSQVLHSSLYLVIRTGLGFLLGFASTILVTKTIGPAAYGLYATATGIFFYLNQLGQMGVHVYLIRKEGPVQEGLYNQAFSLLLFLGVTISALAFVGLPFLQRFMKLEGFTSVAAVFFLGLPSVLLCLVPTALLEKGMEYPKIALIELINQVTMLLVAAPLAFLGFGTWAPVTGFWTAHVVGAVAIFLITKYLPRLVWNWPVIREMVSYGLGYSISTWIWQMRGLINPLLVSRFLGAEYVGYIALALNLVFMTSFVKTIARRVSIAALSQVQGDRDRLARATAEGMQLQVMALGPFLVAFVWLSHWLLPLIYGPTWIPMLAVIPFLALATLVNSIFDMHSSALYVLGFTWKIARINLLHIVLFAGAAVFLIPRFGIIGYGLAEIAAMPAYFFIHRLAGQKIGKIRYFQTAIWFFPFALALSVHHLGWWVGLFLIFPFFWKSNYSIIFQMFENYFRK